MQIIKKTGLKLLISDEGKHIRSVDDVYVPEHIDPISGETIPEHFPHYAEIIFLGIQVEDEDVPLLYIEEKK